MVNDGKLVRDYLVSDPGVSALAGARIFFEFPANPTFPLVLITKFAGSDDLWGHLSVPRLQIEAYADFGGGPQAMALDLAIRDAMKSYSIASATHAEGVAAGAQLISDRYFPDLVDGGRRHRPRWIMDYQLWLHPHSPITPPALPLTLTPVAPAVT